MRCGDRGGVEAEVGGPHDLALAHGNAARDLREIFAEPDLDEEFLDLAERAGVMQPLGIGRELADRLDIGREPGEAMGGALLAIEQALDRMALDRDPRAHGRDRVAQHRLGGEHRLARQHEEFEPGIAPVGLCSIAVSPGHSRGRLGLATMFSNALR